MQILIKKYYSLNALRLSKVYLNANITLLLIFH